MKVPHEKPGIRNERTIAVDSIAFDRLRESIKDAREIRLACLESYSDINVIHERAVRINFNLCLISDEVYAVLGREEASR